MKICLPHQDLNHGPLEPKAIVLPMSKIKSDSRTYGKIGLGTTGQGHSKNVNLTYLEALDLDELFKPVNDVDVSPLIVVGNVAGLEPAIFNRLGCCFLIVQVSKHHLQKNDLNLMF